MLKTLLYHIHFYMLFLVFLKWDLMPDVWNFRLLVAKKTRSNKKCYKWIKILFVNLTPFEISSNQHQFASIQDSFFRQEFMIFTNVMSIFHRCELFLLLFWCSMTFFYRQSRTFVPIWYPIFIIRALKNKEIIFFALSINALGTETTLKIHNH